MRRKNGVEKLNLKYPFNMFLKSIKTQLIAMLILTTGATSKAQNYSSEIIRTGDLLFRETMSNGLSKAIDKVTQTEKHTHFSHIGLAVVEKDSVYVLHASPIGGTCKVSLNEFSHPEGDSTQVTVYRLKTAYQEAIPAAIDKASSLLGKPYNFSYLLSDTSHYCSEFIYLAFAQDSIFQLNPMTFKNPETGRFAPTWVSYYQQLGIDIPEGNPGCNPNGLAASEKIERIVVLE
ncbi:YiiX/YebB-like N1pC/P60 family cysteine hydrolase [Sunxiuqinia indica]|uniref:YiiX/YebB-like N1pC/P60 family cysteine hydrolase n=1 Tax=Sunxiuqinia indica TaxID=2692584 RepID=UPI00191603B1|nr:YiiX/YebB-like N1pC/P60 family cysteine hydrolase [Sunxiuqinia indica]